MSSEMYMLLLAVGLTALLWLPYILAHIVVDGPVKALTYAVDPVANMPAWAKRARAAHFNAVENLVLFAALILAVEALGANSGTTATWAAVYVFARLAHAILCTWGIPLGRTLAFFAGWLACIVILIDLLNRVWGTGGTA